LAETLGDWGEIAERLAESSRAPQFGGRTQPVQRTRELENLTP